MAHLTVAASEATFTKLFNAIRDTFSFAAADSIDFGRFTAGYNLAFHLEGGSVDLRSDNTVLVDELGIKWDRLDLSLGVDIPELCVGGFCIIPSPLGCVLRAPRVCVFSDDPDFTLTLPLGGITSEVSLVGQLVTRRSDNPNRPAGMNDWDAQDTNPPVVDKWQLFLDPEWVDVDPIDVADTVGDLLEHAANAAVDAALWFLPGWASDIVKGLLGSVIGVIRDILDIPDDIQEWISDLLNVSFGLLDLIAQFILEYFASRTPLHEIEDPFPAIGAAPNPNGVALPLLVPVKVPIRELRVFNDDFEMVLEANIG